jgi:hypothetical protein
VDFRIERGVPTDEELAAIVGVLFSRRAASGAEADAPAAQSRWAASARPGLTLTDGRPSRPGRDGWRASALPR